LSSYGSYLVITCVIYAARRNAAVPFPLAPNMDASSPPRYSGGRRHSALPGRVSAGSELPAYSRRTTLAQPVNVRREPTEHIFQCSEGKGRPWVTLRLLSSAKSAKSLPTYFEKENITGSLEIDAERGDSIQAVSVTVRKDL